MPFTDEQIKEFQELYFKTYGKEISEAEARDQAEKLLRLMVLIYKPMSIEDYEAIQKRRIEMLPETIQYIAKHD